MIWIGVWKLGGGNRPLDQQFTFLSKQQLNLLSFSQLTSCSKKGVFQLLFSVSSNMEHCSLNTCGDWGVEAGRAQRREGGIPVNLKENLAATFSSCEQLGSQASLWETPDIYHKDVLPQLVLTPIAPCKECAGTTVQGNTDSPRAPHRDARWEWENCKDKSRKS